jgi:hypothetical protein
MLHTTFEPTRDRHGVTRPLTVTGVYMFPNDPKPIYHQMILERVENDHYVLFNTLHSEEIAASQRLPLLRIHRKKRYFYQKEKIVDYYDPNQRDYIYKWENKFMRLTSELTMKKEEWYLFPTAYSITITPEYPECPDSLGLPSI